MSYDDWKLATPPEYDEQHSVGCDGVHDDDAGDLRCTVCYWQPDDDECDCDFGCCACDPRVACDGCEACEGEP